MEGTRPQPKTVTRRAIVEKAVVVGYEAGYRAALLDLQVEVCEDCPDSVVARDLIRAIRQVEIVGDDTLSL